MKSHILNQHSITSIWPTAALPSIYVSRIRDLLRFKKQLKVVLWVRVSRHAQWRGENWQHQAKHLKRQAKGLGCRILKTFSARISGWETDRADFHAAIDYANRHSAILVAESSARLLRSKQYLSDTAPNAMPSKWEWENLLADTRGVRLATLWHPDLHPRCVRSRETKRGLKGRGASCGRPRTPIPGYKKARRERILSIVQRQRARWGFSIRLLAAGHDVPPSTIKRWLDRAAA